MKQCTNCKEIFKKDLNFCTKCGAKLKPYTEAKIENKKIEKEISAPKIKDLKFAGFWIRFFALIIDCIFSSLLFSLGWIVNVYLTGKYGWSIGKKLLGLKVVKEDGTCPIGIIGAVIREIIGKFISGIILGIGFLMVAFDSKKQGLHDKIAKTYVVYG